jgi:hypothetical protein
VWDKVGLGHNGQRLPNGGHEVFFLSGISQVIPGTEWPQFQKNQKALLAARTAMEIRGGPALTAKIRLPSGQVVDHYDGPYRMEGSTGSASSGTMLSANQLMWYRLDQGTFSIRLTLGDMKSKKIEVEVTEGIATPKEIVLDMTAQN